MKKVLPLILLGIVLLTLAVSCTMVEPVCATSNEIGSKQGKAEGTLLFHVLPIGGADFSILSAARNGNIKQISTVDVKQRIGLLTTKVTTIVTGE